MIVLVGGGGFLGSHVRLLLRQLYRGDVAIVSRSPLRMALSENERFIAAEEFALDAGDRIVREARAIVYMATMSTPSVYADRPWMEVTSNVAPATLQFDRIARLNPSAKIVFISSGGTIYGDARQQDRVGEDSPPMPISAYGLGKLMLEEAARYIHRTMGIRMAILRVSNPVGTYAAGGAQGLVPNLIRAMLDQSPVKIFGDGGSIRDYVDADDVAAAIWAVIGDQRHPFAIWNVGSGVGHSTMNVVAEVEHVACRPVPRVHVPPRSVDVRSIVLDCSKIADDIGWRAKTPLRESIARIWETHERLARRAATLSI